MKRPWRRNRRDAETAAPHAPPPVVLGTQLAAAQAQEAKVRAAHPELSSPLNIQYDFWSGETDLTRLVPSAVDFQVRSLVHRFGTLDEEARSMLRTSLTIDDLYTILQFCQRATVASLSDNDADLARDALAAIGLVDVDRVDWRDIPGPLELTAYAVRATGGDLAGQLRELRSKAAEKVGSMIGRLQDPTVEPSLDSAGYVSVRTRHGLGLVDCWSGGSTSASLGPVLVRLADAVDADVYRTSSVTLSAGLPAVWFPKQNRERAEAVADAAPAGGSVSARHRPGPDADAQQFTVFVLDAGTSEHADELLRLSHGEPGLAQASLALVDGSLFVLLIARSWMQGTDGIETTVALERFREPFLAALRGEPS